MRRMKIGVGSTLLLVFSIAVPFGYMAKGNYESIAWIIGMLYALGTAQMRKVPNAFHGTVTVLATAGFLVSLYFTGDNLHTASSVGMASVAFCHLYFWMSGRHGGPRRAEQTDGSGKGTARARFDRLSVFLSNFSYSLYLVHFSVLTYLWFYLHDDLRAWQLILLSFGLANIFAYGYFLLVERHFHKVGKMLKLRILR
jgi:peptidoglycan/LPS O-acetylase OafA/YrhL